jgi:hypothetical protein
VFSAGKQWRIEYQTDRRYGRIQQEPSHSSGANTQTGLAIASDADPTPVSLREEEENDPYANVRQLHQRHPS